MFRTLLTGTFGAVLALALACAGLAWWGSSHATFQFRRSHLANDVLIEHLRLRATAGALLREAAMDGLSDHAKPFDAAAARIRLREHFATMRSLIAAEVALLPNDAGEREELEKLAALEVQAHSVVDRLEAAATLAEAGQVAESRLALMSSLVEGFGERFRTAVDEAVAEEREEAEEAEDEAEAAMALVAWLSKLGALAAVLVAAGALITVLRRLQRPLDRLAEAAQAVTAGDLARRIEPAAARGEFAPVARSFNTMVDEVARGRAALEQSRDELERAVVARTAELAAANATLRRSDDARRRFLADVSHELRTPLTVMRGEAEISLRGADKTPTAYREALARVAEEAAHTARLVDDLLFVARSEAGEARTIAQAVALDDVVRRAAAAARTLAEMRGVRVVERTVAQRVVVQGDPDRLRQLVLILLDNAIRYSDPGAEVIVTLGSKPDSVELTVTDRGMGISPEELDRVFERFYRGEGAPTRYEGGSGLGLPLARAIARAHGGDATLESRLGEGTTARVTLPAPRRLQAVA